MVFQVQLFFQASVKLGGEREGFPGMLASAANAICEGFHKEKAGFSTFLMSCVVIGRRPEV